MLLASQINFILHYNDKTDLLLTLKTWVPINHLTERSITFQPTYANLLSSNITQHYEFTQKPFPAKTLLKQTTYLLLETKNTSYFIVCVKTRNPIVPKLITTCNKRKFRIRPFSEEPFLE